MSEIEWTDERYELLQDIWTELMNDASDLALAHAGGYVDAFHDLGLLNGLEREAWQERFKRCPEPGDHGGGRAWCAYCGTLPDSPDWTHYEDPGEPQ